MLVVQFCDEEVEYEVSKWKKALIVYVLRDRPPFSIMKFFIEKKWSKFGKINLYLVKIRV